MPLDALIHPTAVVHPSAWLEDSVVVGPYAIIGENVRVGAHTTIGAHAVVEYADIGASCQIFPHSFVGTAPQDLKYRGEKTKLVLGDGCIVRECVTLNRGTTASMATRIGKKCLFMAYSHVAHDCQISDEVILANNVAIAGHVEIGSNVIVGGLAGVHQFVKIGKLAMIAAGSMVSQDVPPFCTVWGDRAKIVGLNLEGLKRRHFSPKAQAAIKKIYQQLFFGKKTLEQNLKQLSARRDLPAETQELLQFIRLSKRGVCRPRPTAETGAQDTW